MSATVTIRTATFEDREGLAELWQELMDFHRDLDPGAFDLAPDAQSRWIEDFDEWLVDEHRRLLVADTGSGIVGFIIGVIGGRRSIYEQLSQGMIGDTCVTKGWRRRGVGTLLVRELVAWFRGRGVSHICVHLAAANPISNSFWREMGFQPFMVQMRLADQALRSE
jgi:GNAT superfamily N-acetyltransferase